MKIHKPKEAPIPINAYATHQEVIVAAALQSHQFFPHSTILEIGCGHYSTPLLSSIAKSQKRDYEIIVKEPTWGKCFASFATRLHFIGEKNFLGEIDISKVGLIFIDEDPFSFRLMWLYFAAENKIPIAVCHDAENLDPRLLNFFLNFYPYVYVHETYFPPTVIFSTADDPKNWF
ncbi:MAG: hypothetical protein WCP39_02500 [Chlamydiota bacterium]